MKKELLVGVLGLVLVLVASVWFFRPGPETIATTNSSVSSLSASEISYDFGRISMKNGVVEKTFTVTNTSSEDVLIEKITTSCMCTTAFITRASGEEKGPYGMVGHGASVPKANETIKAGETRTVRVVFDPNAHGPAGVGLIERLVMLEDSYGDRLDLSISVTVTP
ncbi:MAG: hypothetical protein A3J09_01080 [Candidatus Zambryskibacteria bacterium RIFCSPLOWO2_02_FULL_51_21]|uniref:DUF1573 domain-containing protein n=1 Tax=Candidatus Zambryskibacteria bacterium RIFCSPHIGHO2_02_FULL_43_37 TaxID=1802749 RepID=A0A1G2TIZ6_9BACT|nr:MAG: hypothetical protein A2723_01080 [Candidatus Zambryskibacteria bacterium RIFCSPHIGHO2_01_FULL_52_18]OHA96591.1 MAG: hypothetical protein A3D49_01820 [Candidatus Zambryskibacteria bacterium RIFCSPHIGHO2_02_FULL_43_37]OHB07640.1 MAG: hypothetical protein A2944_00840 [Candidatus Zambryskibacteria bacterium RIFCSPLOWO2_01_FULL_52_12]OHB11145.1 MAG: hypothetical protein A3J09_01080 [Candidatus Zambryskibacteria bacterium RIFCSPLOWO2_02_FULL_51_21]